VPNISRRISAAALTCLCAACAMNPAPEPPEPVALPVAELPAAFAGSTADGSHAPLEWWRAFGDPVLDEVVETVIDSNFDMAAAVARLQQARTGAHLAGAAILPVVSLGAHVDTFDTPINAGFGAQLQELGLDRLLAGAGDGLALPDRLGLTTYALSANFAYELDFWGRNRHASLAAGSSLLASEADAHTVRIGILAETITAYFDIVALRRQIVIGDEIAAVLLERERLAESRYDRGLADSLELQLVREALRDMQAGLPRLDTQLAAAEGRLAVLMGGYREDVAAVLPDALAPEPGDGDLPVGVPARLLQQRPDVLAARHRLVEAGHHVEVRRAALLPSLSFAGTIGLQTTDVAGLFDVRQWFSNLAANLLAPVFDGGRLGGEVALAQARFDELAAAYGRTVVTAVSEVETALITLRNEARRSDLLAARHAEAQSSLALRSERYASGLGGYAAFLDASRTLLDVESAMAGSDRDLAMARLAVHRALGGAWTAASAADERLPLAGGASVTGRQ